MQCARHNQETVVSCGRCDAPVCPRCMVYTDVGVRCRDCSPRQRSRPVWGGNSVITGAVIVFILILAVGAFSSVGLYSGGGSSSQSSGDFTIPREFLPDVTVRQVLDPWTPEAGGARPSEGRRFVAIEVTVAARSDGAANFASPSAFKLTDSEDFAYGAVQQSLKAPGLGEIALNPGEKTAGWVVFEINDSNTIVSLEYLSLPVDLP